MIKMQSNVWSCGRTFLTPYLPKQPHVYKSMSLVSKIKFKAFNKNDQPNALFFVFSFPEPPPDLWSAEQPCQPLPAARPPSAPEAACCNAIISAARPGQEFMNT